MLISFDIRNANSASEWYKRVLVNDTIFYALLVNQSVDTNNLFYHKSCKYLIHHLQLVKHTYTTLCHQYWPYNQLLEQQKQNEKPKNWRGTSWEEFRTIRRPLQKRWTSTTKSFQGHTIIHGHIPHLPKRYQDMQLITKNEQFEQFLKSLTINL